MPWGRATRRVRGVNVKMTGSITFGSKAFIENVKARLNFRSKGRNVIEPGGEYQLRENLSSCKALFGGENEDIDLNNTYFWDAN